MTTAPKLAKQFIQTCAAIKVVEQRLQEKLDRLVETRPFYQLFDDVLQSHPYAKLPLLGQNLNLAFTDLFQSVAGWNIHGETVIDAIGRTLTLQMHEGEGVDASVSVLSALLTKSATAEEASEQLRSLFHQATLIWSRCDNKTLKAEVTALHGKKGVVNNMETPLLNISPECKDAVKEVTKLAKLVLGISDGNRTIGEELEQTQAMHVLNNGSTDTVIALLLKK